MVTESGAPIMFVEAKWSDAAVDGGLQYMKARFPGALAWQVHATGKKDYVTPEGIRVAPAIRLLSTLM